MPKIGIFIPCYNVEKSITNVLNSFTPEALAAIDQVVVTDNCSQDKTLAILKNIQSSPSLIGRKLVIIKNNQNYGLGGTQKIAYRYFIENGFSHFMIVHGDGQGNGGDIAQSFLRTFTANPQADVILASRFMKKSDTAYYNRMRTLGNHVFNFLTFLLTGHKMTDSGAAILFYRTEILNNLPFEHLTNSFQFNPQLNILLYNQKNLKIIEVPLKWTDSKDESNIKALNYCLTLLKILLGYRFNKTFRRKKGWEMFHAISQQISPSFELIKPNIKEYHHGIL